MRTRLLRRASVGALALTLIGGGSALADEVYNTVDASIDATVEVMALTAGGTNGTTTLNIRPRNSDGINGCNLANAPSLTVDIASSTPTVATVSPATVTFEECSDVATLTVTPLLVGSTTVSVSQNSNTSTGTFDYAPATFQVDVTAPAGSKPTVTINSVGTGNEGSNIGLAASTTNSPTSFSWSYVAKSGVDSGATCSFATGTSEDTTINCTDDGVYTATLTATNAYGSNSASADVTVSNAAPVIGSASFGAANLSCGTDNASLVVSFTDVGSNDTHSVSLDWESDGTYEETVSAATSGVPIPHTYGAGTHTASVKVTDDDGDFATTTAPATVNYQMSAILQPINTTGSRSLFKYGSTIPVKIQILGCDNLPAVGLAPTLSVRMSSADPITGVDETIGSTSSADTGTVLRYSGDGGIYIYNLATKTLADSTAGYQATVTIPGTGQYTPATFGLKK